MPPQYFDPNLIPRSLDSIYNAYLAHKDRQRQLGSDLLSTGGIDPSMVTSGAIQQAGQPMVQGEDQIIGAIRSHLDRKRKSQGLESQTAEANLGLTQAKTANEMAEAEARLNPSLDPTKVGKVEESLRGELQKLSKPFFDVRDAMGRIEASAKNPTAAGDLALIFNYMKVLDPGSTVREGEFATAQNSAGLPARVVAQYNKVLHGERLAGNQRQDFLDRARELYKSQEAIQRQQEGQYRALAQRMRANPENVILNQGLPAQAPTTPAGIGGISLDAIRAERARRANAGPQQTIRR